MRLAVYPRASMAHAWYTLRTCIRLSLEVHSLLEADDKAELWGPTRLGNGVGGDQFSIFQCDTGIARAYHISEQWFICLDLLTVLTVCANLGHVTSTTGSSRPSARCADSGDHNRANEMINRRFEFEFDRFSVQPRTILFVNKWKRILTDPSLLQEY